VAEIMASNPKVCQKWW